MSLVSFHSPLFKHPVETSSQSRSRPVSISESVSAQAASIPRAIAVADKEHELTYQEVDARAEDLARHLRTMGVGPNSLVALCLPRSVAMVVGALGILKAGGAYLPLDPAYPASRISFQLSDAQVSVVVTEQWVADRLPTGSWRVIALDCEGRQIGPQSSADESEFPEIELHGEDLAYVIYTSGSTGKPKGVQLEHRNASGTTRRTDHESLRRSAALHSRERPSRRHATLRRARSCSRECRSSHPDHSHHDR